MNMQRILFAIFLFMGLSVHAFERAPWGPPADRLIATCGEALSRKYDMQLIGTGGAMFDCVHFLDLTFLLKKPINQSQARALIVNCIQEFLYCINSDEEIRPYLDRYPATTSNVRIGIIVNDEQGCHAYYPFIGSVSNINENIDYRFNDPSNTLQYRKSVTETYQEAIDILKDQGQWKQVQQLEKTSDSSNTSI